jgi:hypothetical protein
MTATSPLNYRKTKTGSWVAYGPATLVHTGTVEVLKRDGTTKTETIDRVGRSFQVDGIACAYGYLAQRTNDHAPASATKTTPAGGVSEKQLATLAGMLRKLERVHQFDSHHGNGFAAAGQIRGQINAAGGDSKLTRKQASELIATVADMLDDEM